jgi:hypothetical protein
MNHPASPWMLGADQQEGETAPQYSSPWYWDFYKLPHRSASRPCADLQAQYKSDAPFYFSAELNTALPETRRVSLK